MTRFAFAFDHTVWGLPFKIDVHPDMSEFSFLCFHIAWWRYDDAR